MAERYDTVDDHGKSFVAQVGDHEIKFTRQLSANLELALNERRVRTAEDTKSQLVAALEWMAPDIGDAEGLFDRMASDEIVRMVRDASKALRAVPTIEPVGSSPRRGTVDDGTTGAVAPV